VDTIKNNWKQLEEEMGLLEQISFLLSSSDFSEKSPILQERDCSYSFLPPKQNENRERKGQKQDTF
jgi:hypothetical protein